MVYTDQLPRFSVTWKYGDPQKSFLKQPLDGFREAGKVVLRFECEHELSQHSLFRQNASYLKGKQFMKAMHGSTAQQHLDLAGRRGSTPFELCILDSYGPDSNTVIHCRHREYSSA